MNASLRGALVTALAVIAAAAGAQADPGSPALAELSSRVRRETRAVGGRTAAHCFARPVSVTVDGRLDEWTESDVIALDQPKDVTSDPPAPEDFVGYAMVGWSPTEPGVLFVAAALADDVLQDASPPDVGWFNDDTLEFLVDFRNERQKSGALQHGAGLGGRDLSGACTIDNTRWVVRHDGGVTYLELAIDYRRDNPYRRGAGLDFVARPGLAIGFSIGYDDGEGGRRQSQWGWTPGTTWDAANWGYLVFVDRSGVAPAIAYAGAQTRAPAPPPAPAGVPADTPVTPGALYVSVSGDDAAAGDRDHPLATLGAALARAAPSGSAAVYLRGGVYRLAETIRIGSSGSESRPLRLAGAPGELPVLDFSEETEGRRGIELLGSWWEIDGIVVQNAGDNGLYVQGSHNLVRRVVTRWNRDSGLQLHTGASYTTVVDCDSYGNYDPSTHGENADGFAAKFGLGEGNVFRSCRAWNNADDGWDLWQAGTGVLIESSWSVENGVDFWGDGSFQGDGNGFKLGQQGGEHRLIRCVAALNREHGFDVNGNTSGVALLNNTTRQNGGAGFHFDDDRAHRLTNNLVQGDRVLIASGVVSVSNSWDLGIAAAASDFESSSVAELLAGRGADGSLPLAGFMRPLPASPLVDRGVNVGLTYLGRAPDLGAVEVR